MPVAEAVITRGNGRESSGPPLQARRSLSIILVRPATVLPVAGANAAYELPPLGLAYLAASLKKAGHQVQIIDAFGEAPSQRILHAEGYTTKGLTGDQIVARMPRDVDLIGVGCMFSHSWFYSRQVIAEIAAALPDVPLIVGGEHPTADHRRLLRGVPEVLCCVLGEGEETIVDIAGHLSHGLALDAVPGIALRDAQGEVIRTRDRRRIREVDEIPWPDWSTVSLTNYLDRNLSHSANAGRTMPMLASRGCPYQCTFCSSPQMFGTKWVARQPRLVFEELRHYHDTLGVRQFEFHDLTMIVRKDWIVEFSKILIDEGLDIEWSMPSGTRSEALDVEALGWMRRSGCRSFGYAAESGSVEELQRIKKRLNISHLLESMRAAVKLGLVTRCHMIFGLPDQTIKDVLLSLGFATRVAWVGLHDIGCYAFSPHPGSELYRRLVADGSINPEAEDYDQMLAQSVTTNYKLRRSWSRHLPGWSIGWLCVGTMMYFYAIQFLLRPQRLLVLFRNLMHNQKHTYLEGFLLRKLRREDAVCPSAAVAARSPSSFPHVDTAGGRQRAIAAP